MIKAPWTAEQVANLEQRQIVRNMHSYTCQCGDRLWPQTRGWYCINCDKFVQDWAHSSDVTGEFRKLADFRQLLDVEIDSFLEGL